MSKNKPTKATPKKAIKKSLKKPKLKKINGRKAWLKVAQRVHALNKKNELGFTWIESMRFASKNVYPNFKGKSANRIKISDVDLLFKENTQKPKEPIPSPLPKEICDDVRNIPSEDLLREYDWYLIAEDEIWEIFTSNMPMRFAFDGIVDTGIIKKSLMPDMKQIREDMRKLYGSVSDPMPQFIFKLLVQPNKKDDGEPCSYYVLVTMEGSSFDDLKDEEVQSTKELSQEEREKRAEQVKIIKKTKKDAKNRKRPKDVEPKSVTTPVTTPTTKEKPEKVNKSELEKIKLQKENRDSLERILNLLRKDFDDGLLTKRQYIERQRLIIEKFEKGGTI
jgi:hypothetical protein